MIHSVKFFIMKLLLPSFSFLRVDLKFYQKIIITIDGMKIKYWAMLDVNCVRLFSRIAKNKVKCCQDSEVQMFPSIDETG